ncbi:alpha-amylase [Polyplosphaeria fusca]|uniref:Alpha-amylase n=1 Tax=Polyplosphaeria fusca TaxID=682080 RepID=A0A9P4QG21_9PLEO|nr:alpha-amylase [Polyplosphaeria fusca]
MTFGVRATGPSSVRDSDIRETITNASLETNHYHSSPTAWEDQQLYFLLPDRFSTGEEDDTLDSANKSSPRSIQPFAPSDRENAITSPEDAEIWRDSGTIFQNGTLRGIKSKLGYIKRLGVTALWIGPIFKQVSTDKYSYHGYAVQDFLKVDPHFGSREDLRDLVQSAHAQGIYVILDIILNHSGDVFAYKGGDKQWSGQKFHVDGFRDATGAPSIPFAPLDPDNLPEDPNNCAIWPSELQDVGTFTCEGAISNWNYEPEFLNGDFMSYKDIALGGNDPDTFEPTHALRTLCQVYKYWIAYADLDGYRIDTVKHMGFGPTRYLCTTLHEYASSVGKDNFFLVGEVTGDKAFETVETTGLDAALGIGNVQERLWRLPKGDIAPSEYFDLFRNATFLKRGLNAWMRNKIITMIDDHDQVWRGNDKARFCSDGGDLGLAALALNICSLGIPCIYYGTEQAFDGQGGSDRYIREAMFGGSFGAFRSRGRHFFNESSVIYQEISKICRLRQQYTCLRRGRQYLREISSNGKDFGLPQKLPGKMKSIVAWSRIFADQELLCAINTDPDAPTEAFVTVDNTLHASGETLNCIYQSPARNGLVIPGMVTIESRNGKAVWLKVPRAGFVIYA